MTLHEQPTDELKRQLAEGSLGERKTAVAEATLRRRRSSKGETGCSDIRGSREY
jgi:hypothetical protein